MKKLIMLLTVIFTTGVFSQSLEDDLSDADKAKLKAYARVEQDKSKEFARQARESTDMHMSMAGDTPEEQLEEARTIYENMVSEYGDLAKKWNDRLSMMSSTPENKKKIKAILDKKKDVKATEILFDPIEKDKEGNFVKYKTPFNPNIKKIDQYVKDIEKDMAYIKTQ